MSTVQQLGSANRTDVYNASYHASPEADGGFVDRYTGMFGDGMYQAQAVDHVDHSGGQSRVQRKGSVHPRESQGSWFVEWRATSMPNARTRISLATCITTCRQPISRPKQSWKSLERHSHGTRPRQRRGNQDTVQDTVSFPELSRAEVRGRGRPYCK